MRKFKMKVRKGFALIFVIIIALAMIIPALILASSAIPRRTAVTGEAISDRVLSVADATIDKILNSVNTFGFNYSFTGSWVDSESEAKSQVMERVIAYYIAQLNGGNIDSVSLSTAEYNVSTFLYKLDTQTYYALWDDGTGNLLAVSSVGPQGNVQNSKIKDLSTGIVYDNISDIDDKYLTDNLWVELDTNTKYWENSSTPDEWNIKVTAYLISKPEITRTILAKATRGDLNTPTEYEAIPKYDRTKVYYPNVGNWYEYKLTESIFCDYSGIYHSRAYFGRYEVTRGKIWSDQDLYMGGWAQDKVYAGIKVYDKESTSASSTGKFGPDKKNLTWAKANDYAEDYAGQAAWPNGNQALFGSSQTSRNPGDSNGGLQDKSYDEYYVNGSATIVFSVDANGVGWVTINNGTPLPMPPNGAIYVEGNATVSGTVKGQCTVGARNNVYIGGDIKYSTPPAMDKTPTPNPYPDLLGIIAGQSIIIPKSTFLAEPELEIDAAIMAVSGVFKIADDAPWHTYGSNYVGKWYGAQAVWDALNGAPLVVSGSSARGYDVQQTYYDWNLLTYGPPPFFPGTSNYEWKYERVTGENEVFLKRIPIYGDPSINPYPLVKLDPPIIDIDTGNTFYYYYDYNGKRYYYNSLEFSEDEELTPAGQLERWRATGKINETPLYRISWKEQIAEPVIP